jgi:3',5'-cyclic-AMP phosphodiesterase
MPRRRFISNAAVASAAAWLSPLTVPASLRAAESASRDFRFVFMPCVHLRRDLRSPEGFANALQAVRKLSPSPDFILTGGDMCHNMRDQTLEQSEEITDLFQRIFKENSELPVLQL